MQYVTCDTMSASYGAPSGWTSEEVRTGDSAFGFSDSRFVTAADAGSTVTVTSGGLANDVITIAAYRGGTVRSAASTLAVRSRAHGLA
jgi:hypothetical protein